MLDMCRIYVGYVSAYDTYPGWLDPRMECLSAEQEGVRLKRGIYFSAWLATFFALAFVFLPGASCRVQATGSKG